jgi:hypothetical protein
MHAFSNDNMHSCQALAQMNLDTPVSAVNGSLNRRA